MNRVVPENRRFPLLQRELADPTTGSTLIFTNTREQCDRVAEALRENGHDCRVYRGEMDKTTRRDNLRSFRSGGRDSSFMPAAISSDRSASQCRTSDHGWGAAIWREQLRQIPAADLERQFGQGYVARLAAGAEMRTLDIRNREDAREPLLIEYTFEVTSWGRSGPSSRFLPGAFLSHAAGSLASVATRTTTMLVGSAIALDVHMRIRGAAPLSTGLAMNEELAGPGGAHFNYRRNMDGDTIVVERQVRIPRMRVAVSDYPVFAQFCRGLDELEALEVAVRN